MQYLYSGAVEHGEKGIYFSYEETPAQVQENGASFGWDLRALETQGMLKFYYVPLPEVNPNEELLRMEQVLRDLGARRAVIDSLTILAQRAGDLDEIRRFVYQLVAMLKGNGCTALIVSDPPVGSGRISRFGVEESIGDGRIRFVVDSISTVFSTDILQFNGHRLRYLRGKGVFALDNYVGGVMEERAVYGLSHAYPMILKMQYQSVNGGLQRYLQLGKLKSGQFTSVAHQFSVDSRTGIVVQQVR